MRNKHWEGRVHLIVLCAMLGTLMGDPSAAAGRVHWRADLDAALKDAEARGVPVMVWVAYDRCPFCETLDERTFSSPRVVELSTLFECVRDDGLPRPMLKGDGEPQPLAIQLKVMIHPTILFINPKGPVEIYRVEGTDQPPARFEGSMTDVLELYRAQATIEADNADADALFTVGHVRVGLERYAEAEAPLRAALAADPGNRLGHKDDIELDLAICTLQTETRDRKATTSPGVQQLQAFLKAHPNSKRRAEALFFLGSGWLAITNREEAKKCLEQVVEGEPDTSQWRRMAEKLLLPLQITELQDHIIQDPDDTEAYFQLGHKAALLGQYDGARRCLKEYLSLDNDDKLGHLEDAWLDLGICDVNGIAAGKGVTRLEKFLTRFPDSPRTAEAVYWLGCAYKTIGNNQKAKELLRRVVREFPQSRFAPDAQRLLEQLE